MTEKKLQVIPLGGCGEFGMNMTAIRYADEIIVVDCGMMFPEDELLGVVLRPLCHRRVAMARWPEFRPDRQISEWTT